MKREKLVLYAGTAILVGALAAKVGINIIDNVLTPKNQDLPYFTVYVEEDTAENRFTNNSSVLSEDDTYLSLTINSEQEEKQR